jgi:hypothetical protein
MTAPRRRGERIEQVRVGVERVVPAIYEYL